ncbi:UDP-glycosyltransferase 73C3-like [Actinidia eriantha]|uniref:UDP-glycosyltransferase 73C3-like n=1 Tax=Actinidia eriantha TaxID=165200 RepID=UPI002588A696|nr:UDP-glycosyltransferase 73C3-like [Actinidia eriantha]
MAFQIQDLHFVLIPMLSQSYLLPLTDLAKLLAQHGVTVSIITTPLNAARFQAMIDRATSSNLKIRLIPLRFPCQEAGLPEGCENMDVLTSHYLVKQFFMATYMLQEPVEKLVAALEPSPSCIITSAALPWTSGVALKFNIPRFIFHHISSFHLLCAHNIASSGVDANAGSDTEPFLVPNVPDSIELTRAQLPDEVNRYSDVMMKRALDQMKEFELSADAVLVNSFDEFESMYAEEYGKVVKKVWCVGPVSLCNKERSDKFDRGNKASIDEHYCLKWLDSMKPSSVIYACFGSLCCISSPQLIELALGLEASNRPFIWIIRKEDYSAEIEKWLAEEKFEERTEGRGLLVRGWAPQVLILSHQAVGGFLTHCGWNSVMEGVCAKVPLITWPMFAEQFINEKFLVDVLKIGVRIGVEVTMKWAEEKQLGVLVKKEHVKEAIDQLMNGEEEAEEIRRRVQKLGEAAKRAMDEGGSSHWNMTMMIQNVMQRVYRHVLIPEYDNLHGPCSPVTPPASLQLMFKSGRAAS